MTLRLLILLALFVFAGTVEARAETPPPISFVGDVKPLPDRYIIWPLQNPYGGKAFPW